jgi:malate dehydrogenase (oxaloacetate-decarboxylating)(NADP+)
VKAVRSDAIIATGRSDYPNQVNNVLCFPYIFRGALDCGATTITREMEIAAVHAIAELAQAEQSDIVATTYGITNLSFGPEYIIPKPFDPRLMIKIAPAVAKAAEESGVATRPIADMQAYADRLQQFVYRSGTFMKPIFQVAKKGAGREEAHRLRRGRRRARAARGAGRGRRKAGPPDPGRPSGRAGSAHRKFGLRLKPNVDFDESSTRNSTSAIATTGRPTVDDAIRKGVTASSTPSWKCAAATRDRRDDDPQGRCRRHDLRHLRHHLLHLHYIDQVLGKREGVNVYAAMNGLILPDRQSWWSTPTSTRIRPPSNWPKSRFWRPRKCAASA